MERRKFLRDGAAAAVVGAVAGESMLADAMGTALQPHPAASGRASSVPAAGSQGGDAARKAVHAHIDANLPRHIAKIQEYLRQPSISAEGTGIKECAEMTRRYLAEAGCQQAELIPSKGHPGVWGWLDAGARKTLVVYWMYDVQPVNASEWKTPPFEAQLVPETRWGANGRILRARGAINTKGPERAFLNAVESIRVANGKLPVNLMFLCEGEEEMSSPHMPDFVAKYKDRLTTADGVLFPMCSQDPDGRATLFLGNKGIVYMELESLGGAQGGPTKAEIHSSLKAAVDSPVLRLVQALASFTDATGNRIRIAGLGDNIRKPTAREEELVEALLKELQGPEQMKAYGIERWIDGVDYPASVRRLLFDTTCNIDGMWAGYTGPGGKTILPHKANAKLDFRLVPNQNAADVVPLVRKHLDAHGFSDIKINWSNGYDPSQTDPDSALVKAAQATYADYGVKTVTWPRIAGSAPFYLFTRDLRLPLVIFGLGHGSGAHSVDEYLVIDADEPVKGLADMEKGYADFLFNFAR